MRSLQSLALDFCDRIYLNLCFQNVLFFATARERFASLFFFLPFYCCSSGASILTKVILDNWPCSETVTTYLCAEIFWAVVHEKYNSNFEKLWSSVSLAVLQVFSFSKIIKEGRRKGSNILHANTIPRYSKYLWRKT